MTVVRCVAVLDVGEALGAAFEVICGLLAVLCKAVKIDGACEACGDWVASEDDKEAAVYGGDASNDDRAGSEAATGVGAKVRSS